MPALDESVLFVDRSDKFGGTIGLFPAHTQLLAAEVTVCGERLINWAAKIQLFDDGGGTQVDDLADGAGNGVISGLAGARRC